MLLSRWAMCRPSSPPTARACLPKSAASDCRSRSAPHLSFPIPTSAEGNPMPVLYTSDHEWLNIEGDVATIGITDYAQSQLGDVVFVELPKVGRALKK